MKKSQNFALAAEGYRGIRYLLLSDSPLTKIHVHYSKIYIGTRYFSPNMTKLVFC